MKKATTTQLTEDEMIEIVERFNKSGLTRKQFCLDNQYPISNFYYWQKKYHQKYPLTEEQVKSRPGRKPKAMIVQEDGTVIVPSKSGKKKTQKKTTRSKMVRKAKSTASATPKAVRQPAIPEPETPAIREVTSTAAALPKKAPKAPKKTKVSQKAETISSSPGLTGPVIMVKYPNGTKLLVSADISLKRLKEIVNL